MTAQLMIRIDQELKEQSARLAKQEGKNLSELVRDLLQQHLKERDSAAYIDTLWDSIGEEMLQNKVTEQTIEQAIAEVRKYNA